MALFGFRAAASPNAAERTVHQHEDDTTEAPAPHYSGRREVQEYLDRHALADQVWVNPDGTILCLKTIDRRQLKGLVSVMRRDSDREVPVRYLEPIEFARCRAAGRGRRLMQQSGSESMRESEAGHRQVDEILARAIRAGASDLYLDIRQEQAHLCLRIHGQATRVDTLPVHRALTIARALFNRSETSLFQEDTPCDASFNHQHEGKLYRVRANSLPDVRGQSLSCRVRDPSFVLPLAEAGYSAHQVELIERIARAPGGLILVTGETNSGKSTTLAGLMLNAPRGERMIEIADPVEVEFDHCTHVEINHYGENPEREFLAVLAATVRQNPDALVLGEIRDETTAIAAQSMAIQGKRVYSTLHTQSCVAAIPRLQNLGVDRHLLSLREFIAGIVNQNLVPLICPKCGQDRHPDPKQDQRYRQIFGDTADLRFIYQPGCTHCVAGVVGQTLVAEVYPLYLDRQAAHQYIAHEELWRLEDYMISEYGIQSKTEHARMKVQAGLIDPERTESIIGEWTTRIRSSGLAATSSGVSPRGS